MRSVGTGLAPNVVRSGKCVLTFVGSVEEAHDNFSIRCRNNHW
jgi:hypothetical protein